MAGLGDIEVLGADGEAGETDDLDASTTATALDRVHAVMLLRCSGRTQALMSVGAFDVSVGGPVGVIACPPSVPQRKGSTHAS